jgi:pilus assembly protein CpaE
MLRTHAHCFLTTAVTEAAMTAVFQDRRLARIVPTLLSGGFAAAEARYAHEPSPPLIIIEIEADGDGDLPGRVAGLAECCDAGSNLILLGAANDVDLYRRLRRQGVADYLRLPLEPARLVEAVQELFEDPARGARGKVIAVIGAKGGCGASTVACNLAHMLASVSEGDALLVDLDLAFGAGDLMVNIDTTVGVRNALSEAERIDDLFLQRVAVRYDDRLQLLASPVALEDDGRIDPDRLETMIEALRAQARWVMLDLPHQWTGWSQRALRLADTVVVVAPLDLPGLRNTRNLMDWLGAERAEAPSHLLLMSGGSSPMVEAAEFMRTLGLEATAQLPEDRDALRAASSAGKMIAEVRPRSRTALALRQYADLLVAQMAPTSRSAAALPASTLTGALRADRPLGRLLSRLSGRRVGGRGR